MQDFEGKVAVVTGAASGIGRALAGRFAQEGMKVVLVDIEAPALDTAVAELRHQEYDVTGVATDVSKAESVENLASEALKAYGKVHVLCNNAGVIGERGTIWEATLKDWQWLLGVNLWGVVHSIRTFLPIMLAQGEEGHVVNTASSAGLVPGMGIYGVTKHAVVALSESLSIHLQMIGAPIGVSVLCPSAVLTNINNARRNRPPELENEALPPSLRETDLKFQRYGQRFMAGYAQRAKQPPEIAEMVVQAVRDGQFYVLTHYDDQIPRIRQRFENIAARRPPAPPRYAD